MHIIQVTDTKKQLLELLLLGDEQESMIDRYAHPIIEDGIRLKDMIYLKRTLK